MNVYLTKILSIYSNQSVISTIRYIQESFYGGASRPIHSFKNFNKHVKYKIQQPQLFTDYNLYIVQKRFSFHMFHNGTKIKHHYHHIQVTLWKPIEADEHLKMKWGCVCNRGEMRMKMNTWDVNHIEKRTKKKPWKPWRLLVSAEVSQKLKQICTGQKEPLLFKLHLFFFLNRQSSNFNLLFKLQFCSLNGTSISP